MFWFGIMHVCSTLIDWLRIGQLSEHGEGFRNPTLASTTGLGGTEAEQAIACLTH